MLLMLIFFDQTHCNLLFLQKEKQAYIMVLITTSSLQLWEAKEISFEKKKTGQNISNTVLVYKVVFHVFHLKRKEIC